MCNKSLLAYKTLHIELHVNSAYLDLVISTIHTRQNRKCSRDTLLIKFECHHAFPSSTIYQGDEMLSDY